MYKNHVKLENYPSGWQFQVTKRISKCSTAGHIYKVKNVGIQSTDLKFGVVI